MKKIKQRLELISNCLRRLDSCPKNLVSIAPIGLVLSAGMLSLGSMYQQYIFTSKEIQGTHDIQFLIHLRTALKESRGLRQFPADLSASGLQLHYLQGGKIEDIHLDLLLSKSSTKESSELETIKTIGALSDLNRREVSKMLSSREWLEIKRRYGFHLGDIKVDLVRPPSVPNKFNPREDFQRYTDRLDELNEYFHLVADRSNLILDPQLDTYYLMALTSSVLPDLIDIVAATRGRRVAIDVRPDQKNIAGGTLSSSELERASFLLEEQLARLNRTINIISFSAPSAYKSIGIDRLELVDKIDKLSPSLLDLSSDSPSAAINHWNQATELISFLENIQFKGISILRQRLERRRLNIGFQISIVSFLLLSGCLLIYIVNTRLFGKLSAALVDLQQLADRDPLTKLLSRRSLNQIYERSISRFSESSEGIGVCIVDIDFFKQYNDAFGHASGDDALVTVASYLRDSMLRDTDHAFRYGGEEFLLLFSVSSKKKMEYFLESIRAGISNLRIEHPSSQIADYITVSMGAVFIANFLPSVRLDMALLQADLELYKVKHASRNAVSIVSLTNPMLSELADMVTSDVDRRLDMNQVFS
mgnify:CR=1 FL=1